MTSAAMRLTGDDVGMLGFVGRCRFATVAQVARWAARTEKKVYPRLVGLRSLGLVEFSRPLNAPGVYLATRAGLMAAGLDLPPARIELATFNHDRLVAEFAAGHEASGRVVVTDPRYAVVLATSGRHYPDLVVTLPTGGFGALEAPRSAPLIAPFRPGLRGSLVGVPHMFRSAPDTVMLFGMRILVIEDETLMVATLEQGLTFEGFDVEVATDGLSGFEKARSGRYDVIVLDVMLPKMNGFKVCAALREAGIGTPILMLTAKDGDYDHAEALDTGADDFLSKPFTFVVLVAHLRALGRRVTRSGVLTAGDLRLDPATRRCYRGDTEVTLANREFRLLEALMRREGAVCGKAEILDEVWQPSFGGDQNIVEVYVRYLRKKIDIPFGRSALQTVRGAGYRIDPSGG